VPEQELANTHGQTSYLPHHNTVNEIKPEKLRIVFDCAATFDATSLNKEVLQGPDFTNNLMGVLLPSGAGFSEGQDVLRFLWWKNGEIGSQIEVYRMCVHLFGGVWSPSCASFAMRRVAADHKVNFPEDSTQTVLKNFYADCLKAVGTTEGPLTLHAVYASCLRLEGFDSRNGLVTTERYWRQFP